MVALIANILLFLINCQHEGTTSKLASSFTFLMRIVQFHRFLFPRAVIASVASHGERKLIIG